MRGIPTIFLKVSPSITALATFSFSLMMPHFNATALAVSIWSPEMSLMLSIASSLAYLIDSITPALKGSFKAKAPNQVKNGSLVLTLSSKI